MRLAEDHAVAILGRLVPHDQPHAEGWLGIGVRADLLVPGEAEVVCGQACDDVVVTVAVHVVGVHFSAAVGVGERGGVERPGDFERFVGGLFEPAVGRDDVHAAVAADVAGTQAVAEAVGRCLIGNLVKWPGFKRPLPVDRYKPESAALRAE